jgi:hypothetical protein
MRKKGLAQQTPRNSLFRGTFDTFGVFPIKFCANYVGALIGMSDTSEQIIVTELVRVSENICFNRRLTHSQYEFKSTKYRAS